MKSTGIFVTKSQLKAIKVTYDVSGMCLSGGKPMGDPGYEVSRLIGVYGAPKNAALNLNTGEFVIPEGATR